MLGRLTLRLPAIPASPIVRHPPIGRRPTLHRLQDRQDTTTARRPPVTGDPRCVPIFAVCLVFWCACPGMVAGQTDESPAEVASETVPERSRWTIFRPVRKDKDAPYPDCAVKGMEGWGAVDSGLPAQGVRNCRDRLDGAALPACRHRGIRNSTFDPLLNAGLSMPGTRLYTGSVGRVRRGVRRVSSISTAAHECDRARRPPAGGQGVVALGPAASSTSMRMLTSMSSSPLLRQVGRRTPAIACR